MEENNTNAAEATENAAENTAQQETEQPEQKAPAEKTFTQKELDDIVKQRLDRAKKDMPSKEELKAYREWKDSQKTAEQKAADDLAAANSAKGKATVAVNSDGSGNAGDNAGIDIQLSKVGDAPTEFTYQTQGD